MQFSQQAFIVWIPVDKLSNQTHDQSKIKTNFQFKIIESSDSQGRIQDFYNGVYISKKLQEYIWNKL